MKDKLEVGMYVRTKNRGIAKFRGWSAYDENKVAIHTHNEGNIEITPVVDKNTIIKFSYNIIDILEVGDYVNGDKIEYIDDCKGAMREFYYDYENPNDDVGHWQEEIKTIITHEQMEQMAYKVVSE